MSATRSGPTAAPVEAEGTTGLGPGSPSVTVAPSDQDPRNWVPVEIKALVIVAVVCGVALRFVAPSALWLDEALSVNIAKLPLPDIVDALRHDGHPPLYYWLLHVWMQVFGESDRAVRTLSGLFSLATLPLAYVAGRRSGGRRLGWLFVGLLAACPFVLRYATETRMYSLITLLVLGGYLVVDDMVRRNRDGWGHVVAVAVIAAALCYTHYWALWLLGATGLLMLVVWRKGDTGSARRGAGRAAIGLIAGGVLFVPWLPVMLYQSAHTGTPWGGAVRPTTMMGITLTDIGGGGSTNAFSDGQLTGALLLILLCLGVFARAIDGGRIELVLRSVRQFRMVALVIVTTMLIAFVVSFVSHTAFVSRYTAVILPLVLLVAAGGLTRFLDRRVAAGALALVLVMFAIGAIYNIKYPRTEARETAALINQRAHAGDLVLYCPDQLAPSLMREVRPDLEHLSFPDKPVTGHRSPDRVDWVDYATRSASDPVAWADEVAAYAGTGRGVFLVWSGGYRTHQGVCEQLTDELARRLAPGQQLQAEDTAIFEHESLTWFPAAPGA